MPRPQADDYDAKRKLIMDKAAKLFAESGYPGTRMMDISKICGASKSMLYHYFPKKEDLLFAILTDHLERLIGEIDGLIELHSSGQSRGDQSLKEFTELFVQESDKARTRHIVAMLDVKYLPRKQHNIVKALERKIVDQLASILKMNNPNIDEGDYHIYALFLVGTLNGMDLWRRRKGKYSAGEMAAMVSNLFLNGFNTVRN